GVQVDLFVLERAPQPLDEYVVEAAALGRTRLGYKAEHVVDLETGAVVAAEVYSGEQADTATLRPSLEAARDNVEAARPETTRDDDDKPPPAAPVGEPRT